MATDYDTPRTAGDATGEDTTGQDTIQQVLAGVLAARTHGDQAPVIDETEIELADSFELPGADLSAEEIQVQILPAQADEFTCASCFLVRHRSQIARHSGALEYCSDCEG